MLSLAETGTGWATSGRQSSSTATTTTTTTTTEGFSAGRNDAEESARSHQGQLVVLDRGDGNPKGQQPHLRHEAQPLYPYLAKPPAIFSYSSPTSSVDSISTGEGPPSPFSLPAVPGLHDGNSSMTTLSCGTSRNISPKPSSLRSHHAAQDQASILHPACRTSVDIGSPTTPIYPDIFRAKRPLRRLSLPPPAPPYHQPVGRRRENSDEVPSEADSDVEEAVRRDVESTVTVTDTDELPGAHRDALSGRHAKAADGSEDLTAVTLERTRLELEKLMAEVQARTKTKIVRQKYAVTVLLVVINFMLIFASWWWPAYYYAYIPFISLPLVLNCSMIASILFFTARNAVFGEARLAPANPESFVMVMPCYNETLDECTRSLDSLVDQVGVDGHRRAIMIICDGRVRGPGMDKTTAEYLAENVLAGCPHRETIRGAYAAWDGASMDVDVISGTYGGLPVYCILKGHNQGKRDSLIVVRSFLHKYNERHARPPTIFSARFLASMTAWFEAEAGIDHCTHLIGMDADTVFDRACVRELLAQSRRPDTVGVCGYVAVDFKDRPWSPWSIYQSAEYSIAQGLRRLHQSVATKKVSCLPGCCQLLRVCETTCGDRVLVELFGYHPRPLDGMLRRIRATASEDRNHVCLMLTTFPAAQTRQALRARAYTDVPHSWSVFLSQRRRWTLGATSNDMLLATARGTQWWERILAVSNVVMWMMNVFVIASIGCMVVAFMHQPWWIIMAFAGVMLVPMIYYLAMAVWLPQTMLERAQFLAGLFIFVVAGPFINIAVMLFAVWNMDSFGWGKTRLVVSNESEKGEKSDENERLSVSTAKPTKMTDTMETTPATTTMTGRSSESESEGLAETEAATVTGRKLLPALLSAPLPAEQGLPKGIPEMTDTRPRTWDEEAQLYRMRVPVPGRRVDLARPRGF